MHLSFEELMKSIFFVAFSVLCLHQLSCSDEGCPDKYVRINGSCVVYTGNVPLSSGGAPSSATGGNTSSTTAGSAAVAGAQGSKGGSATTTPQGGSAPASSGAGGSSGGATAGSGTSGSAGAVTAKEAEFGDLCATAADCGGTTDYCATPPTEPFYCTAKGCDQNASLCPSDYECFDLGAFVPGEPFICTKKPKVGNGAFGDVCQTSADCKGETNYCAFSPTEPPYCSVSGCDSSPELCPSGWTCFDVGQFVPGEPFICVKPTP
jgi:hypothetical protein